MRNASLYFTHRNPTPRRNMTTTQHTHQVVFGRKVEGCQRCTELRLGMPAKQWVGYGNRARSDALRLADVRAHNCSVSRCGTVCTFGDA